MKMKQIHKTIVKLVTHDKLVFFISWF